MRVTLIEPSMIRTEAFREKRIWRLRPLTLAALAGVTPAGVDVRAVDDRLESIDYDEPCDLVGISVKTFTARRAYEISSEFRARGVPVVLGGPHATLVPDEASQHADAVVVGEAEVQWSQVLEDAAKGELRRLYEAEIDVPFHNVRTDADVFSGKAYLPVAMVETARGCPHECSFCSVTPVFGTRVRRRPASEVANEVAGLAERLVLFVDDNIVGDVAAAKELFRALAPLGVRWIGQASMTMARDRELLGLMRDSGCRGVLVGIESLQTESLLQARKGWNEVGLGYDEALSMVRDHGIAVVGSFVLGLDGDTEESLAATLEFAMRNRLFAALFNLLTPYPGTDLYRDLVATGRLLRPRWWVDPDFRYGDAVFRPRNIEPGALAEIRMDMYRSFYGLHSTARRMAAVRANAHDARQVLAYLVINTSAVREEAARLGQPLGSSIGSEGIASIADRRAVASG